MDSSPRAKTGNKTEQNPERTKKVFWLSRGKLAFEYFIILKQNENDQRQVKFQILVYQAIFNNIHILSE